MIQIHQLPSHTYVQFLGSEGFGRFHFDQSGQFRISEEHSFLWTPGTSNGVTVLNGNILDVEEGGSIDVHFSRGLYQGELKPDRIGWTYIPDASGLCEFTPIRETLSKSTWNPLPVYCGAPLETLVDPFHPVVDELAKEIYGSLSEDEQNNPFYIARAINNWTSSNIAYSLLPPEMKSDLQEVVRGVFFPDRNVYRTTITYFERLTPSEARYLSNGVSVPERLTSSAEVAGYLLEAFLSRWPTLRNAWSFYGGLSAQSTIKRKNANCRGFSNTSIALLRNLGIPSDMMQGINIAKNSGHQWIRIFFAPYGWVPYEPQLKEFKPKDISMYGRVFLLNTRRRPKSSVVSSEEFRER